MPVSKGSLCVPVSRFSKLLLGECVDLRPDRKLKHPPTKANGTRFDTVSGTTNGSKVYIVYENGRAYPEFLVTYRV